MIQRLIFALHPREGYGNQRFVDIVGQVSSSPSDHALLVANLVNELNNAGQDNLSVDVAIPCTSDSASSNYFKSVAIALQNSNIRLAGYRVTTSRDLDLAEELGITQVFPLSPNFKLHKEAKERGFDIHPVVGKKIDIDGTLGSVRSWRPPFRSIPIPYIKPGDSVTIAPFVLLPDSDEHKKAQLIKSIITHRKSRDREFLLCEKDKASKLYQDKLNIYSAESDRLMDLPLSEVESLYETECKRVDPRAGRSIAIEFAYSKQIAFCTSSEFWYGDLFPKTSFGIRDGQADDNEPVTVRNFRDLEDLIGDNPKSVTCSPSEVLGPTELESVVNALSRKFKLPHVGLIRRGWRRLVTPRIFRSEIGVFGDFDVESLKCLPKEIKFCLMPLPLSNPEMETSAAIDTDKTIKQVVKRFVKTLGL